MAFHEVRFPTALSFGSTGGPERRTEIVTLRNGFEERNTSWLHSRRRYDAGVGLRSLPDLETLVAFFEARRGRLHGFRWKDWADYRSAPEEPVGVGDGVTVTWALTKAYRSGDEAYVRPVAKPVADSVVARVDGSVAAVDVDVPTGRITFAAPPASGAVITASFEFDVPVRFDTDLLQVSVETFGAGEMPRVPVVEIRA